MLASSGPVTIVTANGKEKKKKKRKLEHVNIEKESKVSKKKNKMSEVREALGETHMRIDDNLGLQKNVQVDFVSNSESDVRRDRKRNHKEKNREGKTITVSSVVNSIDDNRREEVFGVQKGPGNEDITNMNNMEGQGRKKEKKRKQNKYDDGSGDTGIVKGVAGGKDAGREESTEVVQDKVESSKEEEKKKKKKRFNVDLEAASMQNMAETTGSQYSVIEGDGGSTSSIEKKARDGKLKVNAEGGNKRRRKAKSLENHSKEKSSERVTEMEEDAETTHSSEKSSSKVTSKRVIEGDGGSTSSIKKKARDGKLKVNAEGGNKRKKKAKSLENHSKEKSIERVTEMEEDAETTHSSEKSSSKVTSKRVSFCEDVEIFPSSDGPSGKKAVGEDGLVRGKRFSHEEDEVVKEAVLNYINVHGLGADGLNMVLNCGKHPAIKHCWKEIGASLPWRPRESVYYRAHILFERDQNSSWTPEEYDLIRKFHEKHGSDWKTLAEALGKHRFHVKDTWRRIKLINMKKGKWSQDEYQFLFDSVNMDLRLKAFEERKTKHGMLRDNISWTAISEKLETRTDALCCQKWYDQLTSPMVAEGKWLDTDDYRLLMELYDLDACCMEDVDWDNLLEHRSGDLCRKRWNQMVKHLGDHRNKSFAEQVDVLINRYCPDVLDAREAYNSKPAVT